MRFWMLIFLMTLSVSAWKIPSATRQLLLVLSPTWRASEARLYRLERRGAKWRSVGTPIPVKIGANGMGWGEGIATAPRTGEPKKREGDRRSPAGVFALPFFFGESQSRFAYPYRRMDAYSRCIDDRRSRSYNRIVDRRKVPTDYRSFERMVFPSGLYRYGIFVAHNPRRLPGEGSCIFLHIRKKSGAPTVGCTAMRQKDLLRVMHWLDAAKHPLLIQVPRPILPRLVPELSRLSLED